jgi:hypothetical protein
VNTCLNCSLNEEHVPLLVMQFHSKQIHICPQCLPLLIHKPEKLVEKLPGMDVLKKADHEC